MPSLFLVGLHALGLPCVGAFRSRGRCSPQVLPSVLASWAGASLTPCPAAYTSASPSRPEHYHAFFLTGVSGVGSLAECVSWIYTEPLSSVFSVGTAVGCELGR